MRKIEVSGAFITPDITPAMPTSVNETTETSQSKNALHSRAIEAPVNAPTNSDGAKVPPTPPADTEPVFLPATPSLSPDLPSASFPAFHRPPVKTPGEFYYGSDEAELGNGIAALAVIILSIITFFLILHKRK